MLEVELYEALGAPFSHLGRDRRLFLKGGVRLQVYAVVVHRC
jgi:hypothetical protein